MKYNFFKKKVISLSLSVKNYIIYLNLILEQQEFIFNNLIFFNMFFQKKHQKVFNLRRNLIEILLLINLCLRSDCLILKGEKTTDKVRIFFYKDMNIQKI